MKSHCEILESYIILTDYDVPSLPDTSGPLHLQNSKEIRDPSISLHASRGELPWRWTSKARGMRRSVQVVAPPCKFIQTCSKSSPCIAGFYFQSAERFASTCPQIDPAYFLGITKRSSTSTGRFSFYLPGRVAEGGSPREQGRSRFDRLVAHHAKFNSNSVLYSHRLRGKMKTIGCRLGV